MASKKTGVTKKEIKKIAHLFAATTLYHLGGTSEACFDFTEEEDSSFWEEVKLIAVKMLGKYPDGHAYIGCGSLSDIIRVVKSDNIIQ